MIHSADRINFLGESKKFSPNPLHKPNFGEFKPYTVSTNAISIPKTEYPYKNMRFAHLSIFRVPHTTFRHPHFKGLDIKEPDVKHESFEVEHLGKKSEMEKESKPNEAKIEMGLGERQSAKDFAIDNLKSESGTENTLSRVRDEMEYKDITALPFEDQYKAFLNEKQEVRKHNGAIDESVKDLRNKINKTEAEKQNIEQVLEKSKRNLNHRKKTVVEPIVPTAPAPSSAPAPVPEPVPTTKTPYSKKKPASARKNISEKVLEILSPPSRLETDATTPVVHSSKKEKRRNKKLGDSVGKEVDKIEERLESQVSLDIFDRHDLDKLIMDLPGKASIPDAAREKAINAGIRIPKSAKVAYLKNFLKKN